MIFLSADFVVFVGEKALNSGYPKTNLTDN